MSQKPQPKILFIQPGKHSGFWNMAFDEALLEYLRKNLHDPQLIVRTYQWKKPTLSLGTHQSEKDFGTLYKKYLKSFRNKSYELVRRPTGGRAILHGTDISFSFITNMKSIVNASLADSYCIYSLLIKETLKKLQVPLVDSCEDDTSGYTRSAICFETKIPSDLIDDQGNKIVGSAQLKREGGILQHGAAFVQPYQVGFNDFSQKLFQRTTEKFDQDKLIPFSMTSQFEKEVHKKMNDYKTESAGILERASTTNGSHFAPASS